MWFKKTIKNRRGAYFSGVFLCVWLGCTSVASCLSSFKHWAQTDSHAAGLRRLFSSMICFKLPIDYLLNTSSDVSAMCQSESSNNSQMFLQISIRFCFFFHKITSAFVILKTSAGARLLFYLLSLQNKVLTLCRGRGCAATVQSPALLIFHVVRSQSRRLVFSQKESLLLI